VCVCVFTVRVMVFLFSGKLLCTFEFCELYYVRGFLLPLPVRRALTCCLLQVPVFAVSIYILSLSTKPRDVC
jgi:hypothetical protein